MAHTTGTERNAVPALTRNWRQSFLNLLAGEAATGALRFLALLWVARNVGPERFGAIGAALGTAGILIALTSGLAVFGTRSLAARPDATREIVDRVVGARLAVAGGLYLVAATAIALLVDYGPNRTIFIVFCLLVVTDAANLRWAFVGLQRTGWVAIAGTGGAVLYVALVAGFVNEPHDAPLVAVAHVGGEIAVSLCLILVARRRIPGWRPALDRNSWMAGLRDSSAMTVTRVSRHALLTLDTVLITLFVSTAAAGSYAAPQRVTLVAMLVVGLLFESALPTFVRTFQQSEEAGHRLAWTTARRVALVVVPGAIGGAALAEPLVRIGVGSEYSDSVGLLRVLVWGVVLTTVSGPFIQALWAMGEHRAVATLTVAAAALNVALNVALLPTVGVMGAAIADIVAKGALLVGLGGALRRLARSSARGGTDAVEAVAVIHGVAEQ